MKKLIYLFALTAAFPAFSHAQQRISEDQQHVIIRLVGIQIRGADDKPTNHLYMYDSNGTSAVDDLVTIFQPKKVDSEGPQEYKIKWRIDEEAGNLDSIVSIYPYDKKNTVIFQNGITKSPNGTFELTLPTDRPAKGGMIQEAYIIEYRTTDDSTNVTPIDPYILIKPPQP